MKTISIITLFALVAMVTAPRAEAKDNTGAIVGGIVGGIIIGSILSDDDGYSASVSVGYDSRHGSYGHWEWTSVRTWVPGYHERRYDACGNRYRAWVPGHYTFVRQRVWVADRHVSRHHGHHYDRYDRYDRRDGRRHHDYREGSRDRGHDRRDDGRRSSRSTYYSNAR